MPFELTDVVPWGRSFDEYLSMFSLAPEDLKKSILGCSDGPASFNCQMAKRGNHVTSVDPIYHFTKSEIKSRIDETFNTVIKQTEENRNDFIWEKIRSVQELGEIRQAAMDIFLSDYNLGKKEERYIYGTLPDLKFADQKFDLALCSHFLFLYSKQFSIRFHIDSIVELCRVAKEVRIFPILELSSKVSRHLKTVCSHLQKMGFIAEITNVDYEFQKGGNQMLRIHCNQQKIMNKKAH